MNDHFIKHIAIKHFKCFENFTAEGFGRVNLIGGKNNVGKTAFMEACYLNTHSKNIYNLTDAIGNITLRRDKLNFLLDNFRGRNSEPLYEIPKRYIEKIPKLHIDSNINEVKFNIKDNGKGIIEYYFSHSKIQTSINIRDFSYKREKIHNIKFLDNFGLSKKNIIDTYRSIPDPGIGDFIEKKLKEFDTNIISFQFKNEILYITINIIELPSAEVGDGVINIIELPLIEVGDGVRILISVIILLHSCKDGYFFIDEIENGIHYSNLDKLWEIILTVSKEQNVQVFATTHSKECIESYVRVAKRLGDEEVTYSLLTRLKSGKIHASVRDFELLDNSISQEHEVR